MLLPYASDFVPKRRPWATIGLMLFMLLLTLLVTGNTRLRLPWAGVQMLAHYGILPNNFKPLTLITYSFLHESLGHLLTNCFYLWVFGTAVEAAVGRLRFLVLFVLAGMVGGMLQWMVTATLLSPEAGTLPIVGASAACSGLVGLFAVRYYRARLSFVGLRFKPHVVTVVSLFLSYEILSALGKLLKGETAFGVAHWAHIGGFVFGLGCAQMLKLSEQGARAYLSDDATIAMQTNLPGAAIKRWEILLQREPENTEALREMAKAWLVLGDTEQATSYYLQAIQKSLKQGKREKAASACAEMFREGIRESESSAKNVRLTPQELFHIGCTLEDGEEFEMAAEVLRFLIVQHPEIEEAESVFVRLVQLYGERLHRPEEARVFGHLFLKRFPQSRWCPLVESVLKKITSV